MENPAEMTEPDEGDIVLVIRGPHRGRIGTLDDYEDGKRAIVYFGTITRSAGYHFIARSALKIANANDLLRRDREIGQTIGMQQMSDAKEDRDLHISLLYEKLLILDTVYDRHMKGFTPTTEPKDIFFAFCSADRELAKCACVDLSEVGHRIWFYEADSNVGDSFIAEMSRGLDQAHSMVVFVSAASLASRAVCLEWTSGLAKQIKCPSFLVMPAIIEDCEVPALLDGLTFADFREDYSTGLGQLAGAFQKAG